MSYWLASAFWGPQKPAEWATYDYPELGFSVDLPSPPKVDRAPFEMDEGPVYEETSVVACHNSRFYIVIVVHDPNGVALRDKRTCEALVDYAVSLDEPTIWRRPVETPDGAGADTAYSDFGEGVRMRAICVNGRAHIQELRGGEPEDLADADAKRFFRSFRRVDG